MKLKHPNVIVINVSQVRLFIIPNSINKFDQQKQFFDGGSTIKSSPTGTSWGLGTIGTVTIREKSPDGNASTGPKPDSSKLSVFAREFELEDEKRNLDLTEIRQQKQ